MQIINFIEMYAFCFQVIIGILICKYLLYNPDGITKEDPEKYIRRSVKIEDGEYKVIGFNIEKSDKIEEFDSAEGYLFTANYPGYYTLIKTGEAFFLNRGETIVSKNEKGAFNHLVIHRVI